MPSSPHQSDGTLAQYGLTPEERAACEAAYHPRSLLEHLAYRSTALGLGVVFGAMALLTIQGALLMLGEFLLILLSFSSQTPKGLGIALNAGVWLIAAVLSIALAIAITWVVLHNERAWLVERRLRARSSRCVGCSHDPSTIGAVEARPDVARCPECGLVKLRADHDFTRRTMSSTLTFRQPLARTE